MKRSKLLVAAGCVVIVAGLVGFVVALTSPASGPPFTSTASPGMAPWAESVKGGSAPTTYLSVQAASSTVLSTNIAPTRPTIYLEATSETFISHVQSGTAAWKVWWDTNSQNMASVSIRLDAGPSEASGDVSDLADEMADPDAFHEGGAFASHAPLLAPAIPGAFGGTLAGTFTADGSTAPVDYDYVLFSYGSYAVLVSETGFRANVSQPQLDALALSQLKALQPVPSSQWRWLILAVLGGLVSTLGYVTGVRSRATPGAGQVRRTIADEGAQAGTRAPDAWLS